MYGPNYLSWQNIGSERATFEVRLAVTGDAPQLELMEPMTVNTFLARRLGGRSENIHHLAFHVSDFAAEVARLQDEGFELLESGGGHGLDGDGAFDYFDTVAVTGLLTEIIQLPKRRRKPNFVFDQTAGH